MESITKPSVVCSSCLAVVILPALSAGESERQEIQRRRDMLTKLANVSVVVKDYDEALKWYTEVLGLVLRMDGSMGGDYRFITVGV